MSSERTRSSVPAGLCDRCAHRRLIENDRGSHFVLCRLAATDARFPRYPQLPVLSCRGFQERGDDGEAAAVGSDDRAT